MTICIIPARGGSRRIPGKNIKEFHGEPIIAHSIRAAYMSGLFDRIVVSTDDDAIEQVALTAGAEVWRRKAEYGRDEVGTQDVMKECLAGLDIPPHEIACCLYATAPMVCVNDMQDAWMLLETDSRAVYVMSAGYPPLQDAGQFYFGLVRDFRNGTPLIGRGTRVIHVDASRVCDINTMEDWDRALKMYEALLND